MQVKGTALIATKKFIQEKFGEEGFKKWLDSLSGEAREVYEYSVLANEWYPLTKMLVEPRKKMCVLFYGGDIAKGAKEAGRFSAEYSLSGVYSLFVKLSSPQYLARKAADIITTYCKPSALGVAELKDNGAVMRITEFPEPSDVMEYSNMGYIQKALEVCGCCDVGVERSSSLAKGDSYTEFVISWK